MYGDSHTWFYDEKLGCSRQYTADEMEDKAQRRRVERCEYYRTRDLMVAELGYDPWPEFRCPEDAKKWDELLIKHKHS